MENNLGRPPPLWGRPKAAPLFFFTSLSLLSLLLPLLLSSLLWSLLSALPRCLLWLGPRPLVFPEGGARLHQVSVPRLMLPLDLWPLPMPIWTRFFR